MDFQPLVRGDVLSVTIYLAVRDPALLALLKFLSFAFHEFLKLPQKLDRTGR